MGHKLLALCADIRFWEESGAELSASEIEHDILSGGKVCAFVINKSIEEEKTGACGHCYDSNHDCQWKQWEFGVRSVRAPRWVKTVFIWFVRFVRMPESNTKSWPVKLHYASVDRTWQWARRQKSSLSHRYFSGHLNHVADCFSLCSAALSVLSMMLCFRSLLRLPVTPAMATCRCT